MASAEGGGLGDLCDQDEMTESQCISMASKASALSMSALDPLGLMARRKDLPDDLACFLQQQKQRQARLETTMRSFPSTGDMAAADAAAADKIQDQKKKRSTHEDPLSHRIIEKRRRDRMNNCLADLSRLIPSSYLKKGRGRIEKTEIIEMAIKHIRHLQSHPCTKQEGCELAHEIESGLSKASSVESFRVGYHECLTETMHFLVEKEGLYAGNSFCVRLMSHLQKHFDKLGRASTSEIFSVVGRTWAGTNLPSERRDSTLDREREKEERRGDAPGVKSEFGISSEESGYKTDEAPLRPDAGSFPDTDLSVLHYTSRGWPPEPETPDIIDQSEVPSDLSIHGAVAGAEAMKDVKLAEDLSMATNLYKFKSSIRHRFDSSRSCDDEKEILVPEKRSRLDSTSTDRDADHSFDVDLDSGLRRDSFSPGLGSFSRHEAGRHKSGNTEAELKLSPSPLPGPGPPSYPGPRPATGQCIPVFALSTKGSHYVPLSVDAANLEQFLPFLTDAPCGPFHPVTISVKFSGLLPPAGPGPGAASLPLLPEAGPSLEAGAGAEWGRGAKRNGVIHPPQSVIKNWRDTP